MRRPTDDTSCSSSTPPTTSTWPRHAASWGPRTCGILTETEFAALAPDCEPGTIPPVPELFGLPVYADFALREVPEIAFHAGSHRFTVHVDRPAWERAAGVAWADLAQDDGQPAWAR